MCIYIYSEVIPILKCIFNMIWIYSSVLLRKHNISEILKAQAGLKEGTFSSKQWWSQSNWRAKQNPVKGLIHFLLILHMLENEICCFTNIKPDFFPLRENMNLRVLQQLWVTFEIVYFFEKCLTCYLAPLVS